MTEKRSMPDELDLVEVAELDELERSYCRRSEIDGGKVSRRVLDERQRATEGRALADLRSRGERVGVREVLDRNGQPRLMTTALSVDLVGERARSARSR